MPGEQEAGRGKFSPSSGKQIQIGTGKHQVQTVLILSEPAVDGFPVSKLAFDDSIIPIFCPHNLKRGLTES